jgi:dTDP-glucose 4,6-dehydratase
VQQPLPRADLDLAISLTPSFWARFDGARLFITGGTGFIGSWLVQSLQRANDQGRSHIELVVLTRDAHRARQQAPHMFARADTQVLTGDVLDFSAPLGALDLCIHGATDVASPGATLEPRKVFDTIVLGTRRVLDAAHAHGASRVLLASSGAVYGTQAPEQARMAETYAGAPDPLHNSAAYGNGKRAAESLACAIAAQTGLQVSMARIFALVGPGMPLNGPFAAGNFIRDVLAGESLQIQGDGRPLRSYLYAADLVVWLLRILESGVSGQAYNVGSEEAVSISDLACAVAKAAGVEAQLHIAQAAISGALSPRYVPDTERARQTLQLAQYTGLSDALTKTIQWSRSAMTA